MRILICLSMMVAMSSSVGAQESLVADASEKWVYFSVRPGVLVDHFKTKGYEASNTKYNAPARMSVSATVDLDNPEMKGFIVRAELTYRNQRFYGEGQEENLGFTKRYFHFRTLTPELSLLYRYPSRKKLQVYGGGGIGWNLRKFVQNEASYGEDPWRSHPALFLTDQEWSFSLSAGLQLKKRIDLCAKVFLSQMSDAMLYSARSTSKMISITYRL